MTAVVAPPPVWTFDAIGTRWSIETSEPLSVSARDAVTDVIARFDGEWSRFRDDSVVARLSHTRGAVPAPADAAPMLDLYVQLDAATGGAVNPLVGDSLARLGYGPGLSLTSRGTRPAPADWRRRLTWHDGMLRLTEPATIDVGALGKGRLVDLVLETLASSGGDVVVDASGDLAMRGRPQRIGLEHPFDPRRVIGTVEVANGALCASAVNRRAWGQGLHHVLDARSGEPVRSYAATWACAPTAMEADAIATALFFDGGPEMAASRGVDWVRMRTDGRVEWSPGSKAELFR